MNRRNIRKYLDMENDLYMSICSGDMKAVKGCRKKSESFQTSDRRSNTLKGARYVIVVMISMTARYCISRGMVPEEALNLADRYIMKADECSSEKGLKKLKNEVIGEFTRRMNEVNSKRILSKPIMEALSYINCNIDQRIGMKEVSEHVSLSISYLSRLFKEEVGCNLSDYIAKKRVDAAAKMLVEQDSSTFEISQALNFSSQSYFIKTFKKYMNTTPGKYRKAERNKLNKKK